MIKTLLTIILFVSYSYSSTKTIDKKIRNNQKILSTNKSKKNKTTLKIKQLSNKIKSQNKNIIKLEKDINRVNNDIDKHTKLLEESKKKIKLLKEKSTTLIRQKKGNETQIVDTIVEDFSTSIALRLASKDSLKELIDSEIYTILSQSSKDQILKLNNNYDLVTNSTKVNQKKIKKISSYIKKRQETKKNLNNLKSKHSKSLSDLEKQHKAYQSELKRVVEQQESLKDLLSQLNILKKQEIKKEQIRQEKLRQARLKKQRLLEQKKARKSKNTVASAEVRNQKYAKNLSLDVKKYGSSISGAKTTKYKGRKTIAPLKSFKVVKKFGKYYDPVYKIKLFNESVVLKTRKPKAKVVSVLNGKVVYAKKNAGMLENVVIVQHQNGLHTIYSHLDEIAPTLKVGKWIKKGYVVGRVNNNLTFQATKNSYLINPKDLLRI